MRENADVKVFGRGTVVTEEETETTRKREI